MAVFRKENPLHLHCLAKMRTFQASSGQSVCALSALLTAATVNVTLHLVRVIMVALEVSSPSISLCKHLLLWDPGITQQKWCSSKRNCKAWQWKQLGSHFNCNHSSNQGYKGLLNLNSLDASVAASWCRTLQPSLALHWCWLIRPACCHDINRQCLFATCLYMVLQVTV